MRAETIHKVLLVVFFTCMISACQKNPSQQTAEPFSVGELTPYHTVTPSPTMTATPINAPTATLEPTITSTPRIYTVKDKDTLWAIAANAGITLTELLAANPEVDAYSLKTGTTLIVPAPSGASTTNVAPTLTFFSIPLPAPRCTPSLTGGLYCYAMAENKFNFDIQDLAAQFTLIDTETGQTISQIGMLPLNRLSTGTSLPIFTYFAPPIPASTKVELKILSASALPENDKSFVEIKIKKVETTLSSDRYSAVVQGRITVVNDAEKASRFWIAAVAYDSAGNVVAVRQMDQKSDLNANNPQDFSIYVYSISGKIDHVDVFGEANP